MHPWESTSTAMESWVPRHRITAEQYHRMAEVGLLAPDARVELIEGVIIDMAPIGMDHCSVVDRLTHLLAAAVGGRAIVRVQSSVRLNDYTEPQSDFALLRPREDFYRRRHPGPGDILLLIEVSDTTLRYDREVKVPLYARHGIPEVWLFDLGGERLHVHRDPAAGAYGQAFAVERAGTIEPQLLPGAPIDLAGILPP